MNMGAGGGDFAAGGQVAVTINGEGTDAMKKWLAAVCSITLFAVLIFAGAAMGGGTSNGTITVTVLYNGQPLQNAYIYLQSAAQLPPRQQFFQGAPYILGPSDSSGNISVSVPEGSYHVQIMRRANFQPNPSGYLTPGVSAELHALGAPHPALAALGPPYPGDYTWFYPGSLNVTASGLNLGTVNTSIYGSNTISGTITFPGMKPAADVFVKATTVQCTQSNQCGPNVYPAWTDSNGNYTITVPAGTYYVYATKNAGPLTYSEVPGGAPYNGLVTVTGGQNLTGINISGQIH